MRYSDRAKKIGETLKELRNKQGLKQKEMASILNITDKAYSSYETGYTLPPLEKIFILCEFFHVSPDTLLGFDKIPPLQLCISEVHACGIACEDKQDGFVECHIDDDFDKMTARLSYDIFMRIVNKAKKETNELYIRELNENFAYYMVRYCLKNKDTIIEHISREVEPQTPFEKKMQAAMDKAFEAVGGLNEPDDDDI